MFGRIPICDVGSLDDIASFVSSGDESWVLIFDVDNTLAPQESPLDEFSALVNAAIDRFESAPGVERVIALTNGPQRGVPRMLSRGDKPWTPRRRLGLRGATSPIVVVGDQILTDGVLAWRLGATFLHLVIDGETEPRDQARMRRYGRIVTKLFFRREGRTAGGC
jgi:predicted HAD superfamily phosphohydrolase YqeG